MRYTFNSWQLPLVERFLVEILQKENKRFIFEILDLDKISSGARAYFVQSCSKLIGRRGKIIIFPYLKLYVSYKLVLSNSLDRHYKSLKKEFNNKYRQ